MLGNIIDTSFSPAQLGLLIPSLLTLLLSLIFYQRGSVRTALVLLLLGALGLRIFMILLDPFLNDWDERYHALVAKNLIRHPFQPMLWADPVLDYNYQAWCCNHIWLHKQPFFLWQMALSMKLLGVNEWAMRLPSALMGAFQILLIYRIGGNLGRRSLGYLAAFLFALSYFQLEQTSGMMGREHNDVAFAFYITAGFWALSEYLKTGTRRLLLLVGLFSGIAILIKWVVAFLIFGAWGLAILLMRQERSKLSRYQEIATAFGIALLVALPWQLYIFRQFPKESAFVYGFHGSHLFKTFDEHTGGLFYYLEHNNWMYGDWSWIFILAGMVFFIWRVKMSLMKTVCLSALGLVYAVFSIAGTKSISYVFVINFVIFLFLASLILGVVDLLRRWSDPRLKQLPQAAFLLLSVGLGFLTLQHWQIESKHVHGEGIPRERKIHNTNIYRKLDQLVPEGYVIFNCFEAQEAMFYSNRTCYFWLGPDDYNKLKAKGVKMAAFQDHKYPVPHYLKEDPEVLIIEEAVILE